MKYGLYLIVLAAFCFSPLSTEAEVWSYACAEATTRLTQAQQDVARKHERVHQAKLILRISPDGLERCKNGGRGFAGGKIHCVNHRSHGGIAIKEVMQAERALEDARRIFALRLRELHEACSIR